MAWAAHAQSVTQVLSVLKVSDSGLTQTEARTRLQEAGENTLPEKQPERWYWILLRQMNSAMVYVLCVAAVISFALGDITDAAVILAAVLLNVIVGFFQEFKAEQNLNQLKKLVARTASVMRDGQEQKISTQQIVPGDVLALHAGDHISADARVIHAESLEALESSLTGESESVAKGTRAVSQAVALGDRTSMVFAGTSVTNGQGRAVVVATGAKTELGKIASALQETSERPTPLQKQLNRFSRTIAAVIGVLVLVLFVVGVISGRPLIETFTLAVAVAVSALPEGLIIGVTVILAIGMKRILQHKGLVRRLASAETLGSVTVICTDKTGTLTEGKMRVDHLVTWDHKLGIHREHPEKELSELYTVMTIGLLNNDALVLNPNEEIEHWEVSGNLTERALLFAGASLGLDHRKLQQEHPRVHSLPFNSTTKYMATLHDTPDGKRVLHLKGAPERVLDMCTRVRVSQKAVKLNAQHKQRLQQEFVTMSSQGLRVLALAYTDVPKTVATITPAAFQDLTFAGFIGIKDGVRAEAKTALEACQTAGIRVKMITGDHKLTAQAVGKELGLPARDHNVIDGVELSQLTEPELEKRLSDISIFARVSSEDKLRIVHALQRQGEVVAMTGDGVNDAPALKSSDIGVALGSGTDVAKDASDLVILDDNFQTIVTAVEQGRVIFDNIKKSVLFLVCSSFSEIVLVSLSLFIGLPVPLTAAQILWINLVTDTLPNLALTQEPQETGVMKEPPRSPKTRIINRELGILTAHISGITGICSLGVFFLVWKTTDSQILASTITFVSLGINSLLFAFSMKSLRSPLWRSNLLNNPTLIAAVVGGFGLLFLTTQLEPLKQVLHTTSLPWAGWAFVGGVAILVMALIELFKSLFIKRGHP